MKIAILHHHLNRGGVTQVVANQLRALQTPGLQPQASEVLVLHGGRQDGWPDLASGSGGPHVEVACVEGLDYDDCGEMRCNDLAAAITTVLNDRGLAPEDTILHVHNHSLGKNASLPGALRRLAERGYRLLLQIHDFAEDLRPANYQNYTRALGSADASAVGRYVYPLSQHVHYAVLNSRDRGVLLQTGVAAAHVHLLPNPVTAAEQPLPHKEAAAKFRATHGLPDAQRVVLYPVRGIRRKNLGELLLWAAVFPDTVFALTLPATSPAEVPSFERWQALAQRLALPVLFDVGLNRQVSFAENIAAASRIITTSVAEGFGLTFLESWLHQRLLIGRNLPDITKDFRAQGIRLDHLGDALYVPSSWVDSQAFVEQILALQARLCAAYGQTLPPDTEATLRELAAADSIDFAALTTAQQAQLIERIAKDRAAASTIANLNPWMQTSLTGDEHAWLPTIAANAEAVRRGYSLAATAANLTAIYGTLLASATHNSVSALPHPERVLTAFLNVRRLAPVRVEP